jgi:predicted amidohydrolase YtcJ
MLIRNAQIDGDRNVDIRISAGVIAEVSNGLEGAPGQRVFDARGSALIPGLHDHHIHLYALASARRGLRCGPLDVANAVALAEVLKAAQPKAGWIRATGYHESVAGELDRDVLDAWVPELYLRMQHRSGQAWFLNSPAIEYLGLDDGLGPAGVERDGNGRATGRLFRADQWLAEQLPSVRPDLRDVGLTLASYGVTGVTDASPGNDAADLEAFGAAVDAGAMRQRLFIMGSHALGVSLHPDVTSAAVKLVLDDRALPAIASVVDDVRRAHDNGRTVAFHCVTRAEIILALGALDEAGASSGDRIEHAGIVGPESLEMISQLGIAVVTQPGFIRERGDAYLKDVDTHDLPDLYRCKSIDDAAIPLGGSTDAPYSDPDPWLAMQAAVDRRTTSGRSVGESERVTPERALEMFTTAAQAPGGTPRRIAVGQPADLCLLDRPWAKVRDALESAAVATTWLAGEVAYERD